MISNDNAINFIVLLVRNHDAEISYFGSMYM